MNRESALMASTAVVWKVVAYRVGTGVASPSVMLTEVGSGVEFELVEGLLLFNSAKKSLSAVGSKAFFSKKPRKDKTTRVTADMIRRQQKTKKKKPSTNKVTLSPI